MRLIDVCALLEVEGDLCQGLNPDTETRLLVDFYGSAMPAGSEYAILSHCWQVPEKGEKEVHFKDIKKFMTMKPKKRDEIRRRDGYRKILDTCRRANADGFHWAWVDTCCINRESSSELSEAINSMFQWYANSQLCYVYLQDVEDALPTERDEEKFPESGGWPKWFTRGWTLQELVAPRTVHFFNRHWSFIGDKEGLADNLKTITRIPRSVLKHGIGFPRPSAAQILSWAADRRTTRVEDIAYSLLGLLGVNMPMLYGEGTKAFQRLQEEIIRRSNDLSIFAWDPGARVPRTTSVLADDPTCFRGCHNIKKVEFDEFIRELKEVIPEEDLHQARLQTFSVTNGGIQIWLPLTPYHNCPSIFKATLACRRYGALVTIDLAPWKTKYYRYCGASGTTKSHSVVQQLFLAHQDDVHNNFNFELDYRALPYYGFSYCSSFPPGMGNGSVMLTRTNPLTVMMFNKDSAGFAVVFGQCFGQEWVHVKSGTYMKESVHDWESHAKEIYYQVWNMGAEHARLMADANSGNSLFYMKHVHVSQSIWAVKIICRTWKKPRKSMITIDVNQCTGFCHSSHKWRGLKLAANDHDMPGLMSVDWFPDSHSLLVGGKQVEFLSAHQEVQLGDYGHWIQKSKYLECEGNIFEDLKLLATRLHVNPLDAAFISIKQKVVNKYGTGMENDVVLSLPNNQQMVLLLKALSTHLPGRCLVTRVVKSSILHSRHQGSQSNLIASQPQTSLFTFAQPLVWQCDEVNAVSRLFEDIRKHFNILVNSHSPITVKDYHSEGPQFNEVGSHVAKQRNSHSILHKLFGFQIIAAQGNNTPQTDDYQKQDAVKFFMGMFGIQHLKDYIGSITFFNHLPKLLNAGASSSNLSQTLAVNGDQMVNDPYIMTLVSKLIQRMPINTGRNSIDWKLWKSEKRQVESDVETISNTLGVMLLGVISAAYHCTQSLKEIEEKIRSNHFQTMVQEIITLQSELGTTPSKIVAGDKHQALEEDIVGKILWTCLHGIQLEIEGVLAKVVHCVLNDKSATTEVLEKRNELLQEMGHIFSNALSKLQSDDQPYLWQVTCNAKLGILKHQLYNAEQAKHESMSLIGKESSNS